jgi:hypothetical protein
VVSRFFPVAPILFFLLIANFAAPTTSALANPLPEGLIMIHVQPISLDPYAQNPINNCDDIVQYTTDVGRLEFDLFFYPAAYGPETTTYSMEAVVEWSDTWSVLDWIFFEGGEGTVDISGNQADIAVTWPSCPGMNGDIFHAARFIVDVVGHGHFGQINWFDCFVDIGCPPDAFTTQPFMTSAEAGVVCSYCYTPCDFSSPCHPFPDPTVLDLVVNQGGSVQSDIQVTVGGGPLGWSCTTFFLGSEEWMDVAAENLGWNNWTLTLTVDASELAPGFYEGWVRMEDHCVGCTKVNLTVLPATSVPDEDNRPENGGLTSDPQPLATTWGSLKSLYR